MNPILSAIPHRPPFLFVDDVVECDRNRIATRYTLPADAPFLAGHYPGNPIMPGVLVSEAIFQSGAVLLARRCGESLDKLGTPVLTRIQDARFKRMVQPGETLTIEVKLDDELDEAFYMTGYARVDGQLALRVSFVVLLATPSDSSRV